MERHTKRIEAALAYQISQVIGQAEHRALAVGVHVAKLALHIEREQAASLAVQCAHVDGSEEGRAWLEALIDSYRRYPALRRVFDTAKQKVVVVLTCLPGAIEQASMYGSREVPGQRSISM